MRIPPRADRDFTASAFVVEGGRVLLIFHRKLDQWLQPGGHVEPRETPDEAAIREVQEETGVGIRVREAYLPPASRAEGSENLPLPFEVNVHEVRDDHWHVDFAYLARVVERGQPPRTDEHGGQDWFTAEELDRLEEIDENTRAVAQRAIREVS